GNSIGHCNAPHLGRLSGTPETACLQAYLAAVEPVLLVEATLIMQGAAPRVEIALLGVEPMPFVPIRPLALAVAPIAIGAIGRLTVHGSADPLHDITRRLRARRQHTRH